MAKVYDPLNMDSRASASAARLSEAYALRERAADSDDWFVQHRLRQQAAKAEADARRIKAFK